MTPDRAALVAEARKQDKCLETYDRWLTCREEFPEAQNVWCWCCLLAALVETEPDEMVCRTCCHLHHEDKDKNIGHCSRWFNNGDGALLYSIVWPIVDSEAGRAHGCRGWEPIAAPPVTEDAHKRYAPQCVPTPKEPDR